MKFLVALVEQGYEEIDDVEDLEAEDAGELGMTGEEVKHLYAKAEEWESRHVFYGLLY